MIPGLNQANTADDKRIRSPNLSIVTNDILRCLGKIALFSLFGAIKVQLLPSNTTFLSLYMSAF